MHELRLVAVSEDGSYAILVVPGRSGRYALPIDERLRTVARGQFSRLAQYEIEVESPLRPKEIQDRIRAGETAEDIADAAGLPVDRIRRFEGPVLAEREYRATEAQRATVRGYGDAGPGPRLGDIVHERLTELGAAVDEAQWDSRKRPDGNWHVQIAYTVAGRMQLAEWVFDPRSRHVAADNDQAARLSLPEADWPPAAPGTRVPAAATVTPIGSRARPAADMAPPREAPAAREVPAAAREAPAAREVPAARGVAVGAQQVRAGRGVGAREAPARAAAEVPAGARQPARPAQPGRSAGAGRPADAAAREITAADQVAQQAADERTEPGSAAGRPDAAPAPARRPTGGRSRRSSVPSWDEIMFGSSRQSD